MGLNGVPYFDKPSYSWLQINGIQKFTEDAKPWLGLMDGSSVAL